MDCTWRGNRYRPFKDKKMDSTWVKRGTNQKEGLYMDENVPPMKREFEAQVWLSRLLMFLSSEQRCRSYWIFKSLCLLYSWLPLTRILKTTSSASVVEMPYLHMSKEASALQAAFGFTMYPEATTRQKLSGIITCSPSSLYGCIPGSLKLLVQLVWWKCPT